jgi:hypothetical protein
MEQVHNVAIATSYSKCILDIAKLTVFVLEHYNRYFIQQLLSNTCRTEILLNRIVELKGK